MKIIAYTVQPNIPESLKPLDEIAHNLWLSWNFDAVMLFIRLDYEAWVASEQNPAKMLGLTPQKRLEEMAQDDSYLAALNMVYQKFLRYKSGETWYQGDRENMIAYFSMEYGLDVSLPIYSGGLGVLSGDHLKTSSDMGLPLVGVGLLYRQGYFRQYLNADGYQLESYPENDWYNMPVTRCMKDGGETVKITVNIGDSIVVAQLWEVKVGRNSLYLLDTNIEENTPQNRLITATLYGDNREMRIKQEILLGMGGIRALKALNINPAVVHMNEGHSAFLAIERIRELVKERGLDYKAAIQAVWPTNIFTTHTPVPAGNERFEPSLVEKYFKKLALSLGFEWKEFLALGREDPENDQEYFCMTVLALKLSAYNNGVSALHGNVSRNMWKKLWPKLSVDEIPITHITNGVHPRTWISHDLIDLMDRFMGPDFYESPTNLEIWERVNRISDEELWRTHERRRERLVAFTRERLKFQLKRRGSTEPQVSQAADVLSPYALTISFARRFATYKRANLLFRDPDRLIRLLSDNERPVQLIFSGKAHPHDMPGKELIKEIVHFASRPEIRSKIVFLENYDMTIARHLVSGSDLWLNTPRRPLEASGTSGMKAAINGVLNISVLDGWWDEVYDPSIGWAIGHGESYEDPVLQDEVESKALYDLLEREIIPTFYLRGRDGLPREWIAKMKASIHTVGKNFSSQRMLMEYAEKFYLPALENYKRFSADNYANAIKVARYLEKLESYWKYVKINDVSSTDKPVHKVGDTFTISAEVELGDNLKPEDVAVEFYHGPISSKEEWFENPDKKEMNAVKASNGKIKYRVDMQCNRTGRQGYTVRILPKHENLVHPYIPGFIKWA
ncbi:MAG: alpha-glucan phosphorylase [Spirochaetes bacterium]|nr:MAG: alpha-glucan phosphorylase [Spirochaetota bacterium]